MESKYSITTIPPESFNEGLGDFIGAFSSKEAKEPHPLYNYFTFILLFGITCILIADITAVLSECDPNDSAVVKGFGGVGFLITAVFLYISPINSYVYYRNKNHYLKNIYIFSDGFIWEGYYKNKLKSRKIFNYNNGVEDIELNRIDYYIYSFYKCSGYTLIVDYYDFEKDKWKKFKLRADERNKNDNSEKFTWIVLSMRLIYNSWINHKRP